MLNLHNQFWQLKKVVSTVTQINLKIDGPPRVAELGKVQIGGVDDPIDVVVVNFVRCPSSLSQIGCYPVSKIEKIVFNKPSPVYSFSFNVNVQLVQGTIRVSYAIFHQVKV